MTKKLKTDKRVFDIRASKDDSTEPLVLAISADATLLELHLAFLGALEWRGSFFSVEGAYRYDIAGQRYEGGRGSRTALRRLLAVGSHFSYACDPADVALQCECVRSYEVANRRHHPKVLGPADDFHTKELTWQAQYAARREYRYYEESPERRGHTVSRQAASRTEAFVEGFFTAIVAGPMVMPTEFLGTFMGDSFEDIDSLNAAIGALMERYNQIASLLYKRPDDFIERVVRLCARDATGQALLDWYQGFVEAMALRDAEWVRFMKDKRTADLFKPFGMMAEVRSTPEKRAWLADAGLRRNLSNAFAIVAIRTWELFRESGSARPETRSGRDSIFRLKISLVGAKPPIWRRVLVRGDERLDRVHAILNSAMGWTDMHLHAFRIGNEVYSAPYEDEPFDDLDERKFRLDAVGLTAGSWFRYSYDFGDGWEHRVDVESIGPPDSATTYPICIAGKRACPPEDVGGVPGYEDFLKSRKRREFMGLRSFDPEFLDLDDVNEGLRLLPAPKTRRAGRPPSHRR